MTKRIFRSISLVAISIFFASGMLFMGVLYHYFSDVQRKQLQMQTQLAAQGVENEGITYFDGLEVGKGFRITWINQKGTVLYDSAEDTSKMENHLEREEIKEALQMGKGDSARYSSTLMERSLYCATELEDGTVLRLSIAQHTIFTLVLGMVQPICIIFVLAIVLSLFLASRLSKKIVKPLNEINLDQPMNNEGYDEVAPLLRRIDAQQCQIRKQSHELFQKTKEFETVTNGMTEGIVLLNAHQTILSINPAAIRLFETDASCRGKNILSINRNLDLQSLLAKTEEGKHAEMILELGSGTYQFDASPVMSDGNVSGMILLMFDVTEKERAEQMRREFTANVSHELKTPLHTISGCAELLSNGLVKEEDIAKFSTQIYTEAQRMIRLIEDIIRLSHLDEGAADMKREKVDLYAVAEKTIDLLGKEAKKAQVELGIEGEHAIVCGIPHLLQSIVTNLCDNAIKYNKKNGTVKLSVWNREDCVQLLVSDTGIGIPKEHQERIFERFYRVDKSHSKEIGGTGLGLSIVKHAVRLHNATIDVESMENEGTTIIVSFPKM